MNKRHRRVKGFYALVMMVVLLVTVMVPINTAKAATTEVMQPSLGVDVSRYQGQINWDQVAASGIKFAMIRVGYRTQTTGILTEDPYARYNLQEAQRVGIKIGAYFFSTAVTAAEAVEEATFVANILDNYQVTFPVAYDCENYNKPSSRQYMLDKATRTALAIYFLDTIASRGYTPMFYGSKNAMTNNRDWDMTALSAKYKVWVAWYPELPYPLTATCTYTGMHAMWQYTDKAVIAGINGGVDLNLSYYNYTGVVQAKNVSGSPQIADSQVQNIQYTAVYEVVTPTSTLNLRTEPSTANASTIVVQLRQGDMVFRTAIGNNGWSQVVLNGQIYYAHSSYLTKVL